MDHYKNPNHLQADGDCCTQQGQSSCSPCSNRFTFCLEASGTDFDIENLKSSDICPEAWQSYITGLVGQDEKDADDILFVRRTMIDQLNSIPNPLIFAADDPWPVSYYC